MRNMSDKPLPHCHSFSLIYLMRSSCMWAINRLCLCVWGKGAWSAAAVKQQRDPWLKRQGKRLGNYPQTRAFFEKAVDNWWKQIWSWVAQGSKEHIDIIFFPVLWKISEFGQFKKVSVEWIGVLENLHWTALENVRTCLGFKAHSLKTKHFGIKMRIVPDSQEKYLRFDV